MGIVEFFNQNREIAAAIVGGLIGVFGSVATLVTSYLLRRAGRIMVNLCSTKVEYLTSNNVGSEKAVNSVLKATRIEILLGLDFYNSSDIPQSLRELYVEIKPKTKKAGLALSPKIYGTSMNNGMATIFDPLAIINLPPKELIHLDLYFFSKRESFENVVGENKMFFTGLHPHGQKFKTFISTILFQ